MYVKVAWTCMTATGTASLCYSLSPVTEQCACTHTISFLIASISLETARGSLRTFTKSSFRTIRRVQEREEETCIQPHSFFSPELHCFKMLLAAPPSGCSLPVPNLSVPHSTCPSFSAGSPSHPSDELHPPRPVHTYNIRMCVQTHNTYILYVCTYVHMYVPTYIYIHMSSNHLYT